MEQKKHYKCITLLARNHGLETLRFLLRDDNPYQVSVVFTHKLNPKSYDPERKVRNDFQEFIDLTNKNHIPLYTIDTKEEKSKLETFTTDNEFDFLISISWRYLIPPPVFNKAKIGSINLHRGSLPKYAGVEPIRRALENKENEIFICSHVITENIDEGRVICKAKHPTNYDKTKPLIDNVERLKNEIMPYFPKLTMKSLEMLLNDTHE